VARCPITPGRNESEMDLWSFTLLGMIVVGGVFLFAVIKTLLRRRRRLIK